MLKVMTAHAGEDAESPGLSGGWDEGATGQPLWQRTWKFPTKQTPAPEMTPQLRSRAFILEKWKHMLTRDPVQERVLRAAQSSRPRVETAQRSSIRDGSQAAVYPGHGILHHRKERAMDTNWLYIQRTMLQENSQSRKGTHSCDSISIVSSE